MVRIAVVENEKEYRDIIRSMIEKFGDENDKSFEISEFSTAVDFISDYSAEYDIVFMDIDMPLMNGLKTAKLLRGQDEDVIIIFVTSFEKYAIKGYEVNATDFIVKPLNYNVFSAKFKKVVDKVKTDEEPTLISSTRLGKIKIKIADIYYVSVEGRYVLLHTKSGEYAYKKAMKDVEKELIPFDFIRIDKSYMVNLKHVSSVNENGAIVVGETIPYSRSKKKPLIKAFTLYWE